MKMLKYQLRPSYGASLTAPTVVVEVTRVCVDFKPMSVQIQNGIMCVWGMAPDGPDLSPYHQMHFGMIGTGYNIPEEFEPRHFIGTLQDGGFVWHVFARWP